MAGIKALRRLQLGKESTPGTRVAATTIWRGTGTIEDTREATFPEEDIGILMGTDRNYIARLGAALTMEADATYEQIIHIFDAGVQTVSPTSDSGSGFVWTYNFPTVSQNTIKTYSIEGGDDNAAEVMEYAFVRSFSLTGQPGEALSLSADWVGRQVTSTDFTPTTDVVVPAVEDILFSRARLFIGNDTDTFGSSDTQKSQTFLGFEFNVEETGFMPVETADGELFFSFHKQVKAEANIQITFEHDGTAVAEKQAWRDQLSRIIRVEFFGSALTSTGTHATKKLILDMCGRWENFEKIDERDGNDIVVGNFKMVNNAAQAMTGRITVVNEVATMP